MKFLELRVEAFNRVAHPYAISYSPGLTLVEGENRDAPGVAVSNGTGKSLCLVEALTYALYGKMTRHGNKTVTDEAAHPLNGADVTVEIALRSDYTVRVHRTRAPKGRPAFLITDGGGRPVPVSKDPSRRTEDVAALLGMDYAAFRAAVVMTRGEALAAAGFGAQMAVLEGVLRLDELNNAALLSAQRATVLEKELAAATTQVTVLAHAAGDAQRFLADLHAASTFNYDEALNALHDQLAAALEADGLATKLEPLLSEAQGAVDRAQADTTALAAKAAGLQQQKAQYERVKLSPVCPTCNRPFQNAKELEAQQRAANAAAAELGARLTTLAKDTAKATERLRTAKIKLQGYETEAWRLKGLAAQAVAYRIQIDQVAAQQRQQAQQRKLAEQRVQETALALTEAEAQRGEVKARHGRAAFWAREFGRDGLQAQIFSEALPILNHKAAEYSRRLTGGLIEVAFNPLRTSRAEDLIRLSGGSAPTYDGLSDGEKERINLVIAFALRALARWRLPEPVNLLILDEVVSSVDPAGTQVVLDILDEEVKAGNTVFCISHDPSQRVLFPAARVLRVIREGGEATVSRG